MNINSIHANRLTKDLPDWDLPLNVAASRKILLAGLAPHDTTPPETVETAQALYAFAFGDDLILAQTIRRLGMITSFMATLCAASDDVHAALEIVIELRQLQIDTLLQSVSSRMAEGN